MILIATIALTILHPGRCFQGCWTIRAVKKDEPPGHAVCDAAAVTILKPTRREKGFPPPLPQGENMPMLHSGPKLSVAKIVVHSK